MAISVFSRELRKHSNPQIENILDIFLRNDINQMVDTALLDDQPSSISRPAGILNGVAAIAPGASRSPECAHEENNKAAEPQKPTGKRPKGLVASSKEDRGPWLGLAQLARN